MNILKETNPLLRKKSKDVKFPLDQNTEKLVNDMIKFVEDENNGALGLAAPQVGELKRIFVLNVDGGGVAFINPMILKKHKNKTLMIESCLSVERDVPVRRSSEILVRSYLYSDGKLSKETFTLRGLGSKAYQHELDHLNGILITDYIKEEKEDDQSKE